jgi:hypothetical protein
MPLCRQGQLIAAGWPSQLCAQLGTNFVRSLRIGASNKFASENLANLLPRASVPRGYLPKNTDAASFPSMINRTIIESALFIVGGADNGIEQTGFVAGLGDRRRQHLGRRHSAHRRPFSCQIDRSLGNTRHSLECTLGGNVHSATDTDSADRLGLWLR